MYTKINMNTPKMNNIKQKTLDYLKKYYKKTGHDFYFKSKHLHLPYNNSVIGRICRILAGEGKLKIWNGGKKQHELTYRTNFKQQKIGDNADGIA